MGKKIHAVLRDSGEVAGYSFYCPGCEETHFYQTPRWSFNGDEEKPTFTPSLLIRSGHYMEEYKEGDPCWCTYNTEHPDDHYPSYTCYRCHISMTDGRIQFYNDCTHKLAGQVIDMLDWKDYHITRRT